jgi:hypothetical protein
MGPIMIFSCTYIMYFDHIHSFRNPFFLVFLFLRQKGFHSETGLP